VRSNGLMGSCFANSYRSGGQFLLILKKEKKSARYTVDWDILGPTNEQLSSADDPWLLWVREQVKKQTVPNGK